MSSPHVYQLVQVPTPDSEQDDSAPVFPSIQLIQNLEPVMSVEKAAQVSDVSEGTVWGWINKDVIPHVKMGRRRLINLERLRADLAAGKKEFCAGDYA